MLDQVKEELRREGGVKTKPDSGPDFLLISTLPYIRLKPHLSPSAYKGPGFSFRPALSEDLFQFINSRLLYSLT